MTTHSLDLAALTSFLTALATLLGVIVKLLMQLNTLHDQLKDQGQELLRVTALSAQREGFIQGLPVTADTVQQAMPLPPPVCTPKKKDQPSPV